MPKKENLIGKKFNKLLVLEENFSKKRVAWKCLCDCGNTTIVTSDKLKSGTTQSCGCYQKERVKQTNSNKPNINRKDIVGKTFGKLTVLKLIEYKNKDLYYKCRCECGNETIVSGTHLRALHTLSCGCLKTSYGEALIEDILTQLKIKYEKEKTFSDLINPKTNKNLRFDFYLPEYNCIIEYDGEQHFRQSLILEEYRFRDSIKDQWCVKHNILLFRISYKELKNINQDYIANLIFGAKEFGYRIK